jgi:hypothetical protein
MLKRKVYIETTIVSYLTALPSRDLVRAAHQELTLEWWQRRERFDLYASEAVIQEAAAGHPEPAARRLAALEGCTIIAVDSQVADLARALLAANALPAKAMFDALHVAAAAVHGLRLPLDLELQAHRQRCDAWYYRPDVPRRRLRATDDLHA